MMRLSFYLLQLLTTTLVASTHLSSNSSTHFHHIRSTVSTSTSKAWKGKSTFSFAGNSGIAAMQIAVVDDDHVLMFDKAESNPLKVNGHPAWGAVYTISTHKIRSLDLQSNSFCAGGGFTSSGTLVSIGGNPNENWFKGGPVDNGLMAIRLFKPCGNGNCGVFENPQQLHLTSKRWYASTARLLDGSLMILGGMTAGGYDNKPETDNPTFEFYPPKGNGQAIYSKFLHDALNTNLFPITMVLPSGWMFVAANTMAMLYDWKTNTERRLPNLPNGVRVNYPASASSVLLPLTILNNYTPEILLCGGSTANTDGDPTLLSSQTPASSQCVRMVLNEKGIARGWIIEYLPEPRTMSNMILMPDGKVLIVGGARSGVAGYGNVHDQIGASNAANPVYRPVLYDPLARHNHRFSTNFPSSSIERLYHSTATLIPDGRVMLSGSNPNGNVTVHTFQTRYGIEMFSPPYMTIHRPSYTNLPTNILYAMQYTLTIRVPSTTQSVTANIIDLGYSTHSVNMDHRYVELKVVRQGATGLLILGPSNAGIYPPGYAWLFILADGVPSKGLRVMIGDGSEPPTSNRSQ